MNDWIYGIVAVMLFGTVMLQGMPEGAWQKYVRLFLGALLMLTVIGPLSSWLDLSETTRLSFEQGALSAWMGETILGEEWSERERQESDRWEQRMKEQVNQKQDSWVRQALESTAREYGFLYLDHEVQWNTEKNWPARLTLWVEQQEDRVSVDVSGMATDHRMDIERISTIDPIVSVTDRSFDAERNVADEMYYEPSELRPLHQALQVVWQLEEEQIRLYWQR